MRAAALLLIGLAACDPYSPDLGANPFRCGTDDPACPSGYECVEYSPSERICELGAPDPGDPDAGVDPVECDDDSSIEPNDTTGNAWTTPIPTMPTVSLVQLAICPTSDKDLYRFTVNTAGKNLHVTVTTEVSDGLLSLQILRGAGGAVIANGAATSATTIEVAVNNLAADEYFVQVAAGEPGAQNNYTLDIVTCDGAPCGG